ncbi:MAG: efflux RND transporter periplasmic adaptor subunit [Deltaproteobacteria bacterium]|nr:efflux RND transporter periplasmic adaptor subunit [Deltaproteobacteria bacterium]
MKPGIKKMRSLVVLAVAVGIAVLLIVLKPAPEKQAPPPASLLVEVMEVKASSPAMVVNSYGTVRPTESLNLVSEVKGKVADMSPNFQEGGFFKEDERLISIDPRSYELVAAQRRKQLKQLDAGLRRLDQEEQNFQVRLNIARSDVELAKAEWERFKALVEREVVAQANVDQAQQQYLASQNRMQEVENQIALMDPRRDQTKAQRELVEIQLREALLDLDRAGIEAPFDGYVLEKSIEKGQFVNIGAFLGRIYRGSTLEVEVRIPFKDLSWLGDISSMSVCNTDEREGADTKPPIQAKVIFKSGGQTRTWEGRLIRVKAQVDEKTRTLPLIIKVLEENSSAEDHASYPLKPGMFVDVELTGRQIDTAYLLPRSALHPGNLVYVASNNELVTRQVEVLRRLNDSVYVGKGLNDGDMVITTPVGSPKEGIKLRIRASEEVREEAKDYHENTKQKEKHETQKPIIENKTDASNSEG